MENKQIKTKVQPGKEMNIILRIVFGALFFILGFSYSYSAFFRENPLYGVAYLAEILISITAGVVGFFIFPQSILQLKHWIEGLIQNTVSDIVKNFWDQQSRQINDKRREKQKKTADEEKRKLKEQLLNGVVVDTSVLVDGRLLDILKTGFFDNTLVVPSVVMNELHLISDNPEKLKRERGRRGLDIAKKIRSYTKVINPVIRQHESGVDRSILDFAKNHKLKLMTQDFNLAKLAEAQGIKVLNINRLVEAVRVNVLPGEILKVIIIQEGKEKRQGVGYMPDGTMVIIEEGKDKVNQEVHVKIIKVIQSPAGKIIFAALMEQEQEVKESTVNIPAEVDSTISSS